MSTDLNNLPISELKKIKKDEQQKLKKEYSQYKKKQKLINYMMKIQQTRNIIKPRPHHPNHLMSILRNVFATEQFLLILLNIFAKLLNAL